MENTYNHNCILCDKKFKFQRSLRCHEREVHGNNNPTNSMKCALCDFTTSVKIDFFQHIESTHNIPIKVEDLTFPSINDFNQWKEIMEKETTSKYIKNCGSYRGANNSQRHYYICHRSGYYIPNTTNKRHLKTQGSKKINGTCSSTIQVYEAENGTCKVKFVQTHVGHQNDICHLNLTDAERKSVAIDIANKIPFDEILHKVRDSVSNTSLERIHLLTKKDLYNIERDYNLSSDAVRHSDDGTSVEAWVNEVNSSEHPCVLLYKAQGTEHPVLKPEDFALVIMNSAQSELLKKYGNDCICIDETHGINSYGFTLTSLLILDDLRQGFPCAFLISNRNDHKMLEIFFECVKSQTGNITPNVFMSDMADAFFNAWISVMGKPVKRLFCAWHVDRAWQKNLNSKVRGQEKKAEVYKVLRTLMQERDEETFMILLHCVMNKLSSDPETAIFGKYFVDSYSKNTESWAYCYRLNSGLNTNMHIERMHRTLKYIYLHGKNVKRLDKAINGLMSFVKDKLFDRLVVLNKGKITSKIRAIRKRHKTSLDMKTDTVIREGDAWLVPSSSAVKEMYIVLESEVQCQCKLLCTDCETCMHCYTCTCVDSCIKWNMCKHVHLVCRYRLHEPKNVDEEIGNVPGCSQEDDNRLYIHFYETEEAQDILKEVSKKKLEDLLSEKKEKVKNKYLQLLASVQDENEFEVLNKNCNQLEATLNAVRSSKNNLPIKKQTNLESSQKRKIEPQRRLVPKKKVKKTPKGVITKPSEVDVQAITMSLLLEQQDPVVIQNALL